MFVKLIILFLLGMIPGIQSSKCPPETSISPCVCEDSFGSAFFDCDFLTGNFTDYFKVRGSIAKAMKQMRIKHLHLSNIRISRLSKDILAGSPLTYFTITYTDISEIDKDAFKDSSNSLTELQISHSNLTKIPIEAISNLRKLVSLQIAYSSISSIAKSEMDELPTPIYWLDLSHNKISTIDSNAFDNLAKMYKHPEIIFKGNNIKEIGNITWSTLPSNSELNLNYNSITALPKEEILESIINKKITVDLEGKFRPTD
ncbi:Leucine-rich repeats and immunoglobulin-like domains protein 2 [Nymphon striatum]|nr:Leucine-rich repeats and immunoglobulin-like domains protein 2 [Nymphon striatum]